MKQNKNWIEKRLKSRKKTMLKKYNNITYNPTITASFVCPICNKLKIGQINYIEKLIYCSRKCTGKTRIGINNVSYRLDIRKKISEKLTGRHLSKQCKKKKSIFMTNLYKNNPKILQKFLDAGKKHIPKYKTKQGFLVRSKNELYIANWLYEKNIKCEYENKLWIKNRLFIPDFYLPKYDIYIECFGNYRGLAIKRINFKKKIYRKNSIPLI